MKQIKTIVNQKIKKINKEKKDRSISKSKSDLQSQYSEIALDDQGLGVNRQTTMWQRMLSVFGRNEVL